MFKTLVHYIFHILGVLTTTSPTTTPGIMISLAVIPCLYTHLLEYELDIKSTGHGYYPIHLNLP